MIRKSFFLVVFLCLALSSPCRAEDESAISDIVDRYFASSRSEKIEIANHFFENSLLEFTDSLYVFNSDMNPQYMDAMFCYWAATILYDKDCAYEKSAILCNRAGMMADNCDSVNLYADCLSLEACIYVRMGDFNEAIACSEKCLELDRASGNKGSLSSSLNTASILCSYANQFDDAEKYILQSIEIERTLNRPKVLSIRLGVASETMVQLEKYDEALKYADESLDLALSLGEKNDIAIRQCQKGLVLISLRRFDEARELLLASSDTLRSVGNLNSLCIALRQLSTLENKVGRNDLSINYLKQSLEIGKRIDNKLFVSKDYMQLAGLLRESDPVQALECLDEYIRLNEIMFNDKMAQQLQSSNAMFQTAEMRHQLEVQEDLLYWHRFSLVAVAVVLLICIFVAVLLGRLAKVRGKNNEILRKASSAKDELIRIANLEKLQAESARQKILEVAEHISSLSELSETELTNREIQIIKLYAKGLVSKEVAEQLNISVRTVEAHKNHIYRKLGISTTVELLRFAQQKGIV